MQPFTVIYVTEGLELWRLFECQADDAAHAEEQCVNAYPTCNVLCVRESGPWPVLTQD